MADCVKRRYLSRRAAKVHAFDRMRPYRCPSCGFWHVGHLPKVVRRGRLTAAQVYGTADV